MAGICKLSTEDSITAEQIDAVVSRMRLTDSDITRVQEILKAEMQLGLSADPKQRARTSLAMENTYVRNLLDGKEEGDFLAMDLGGTNFRVLLCHMRNGVCQSESCNYNVPKVKLYGPSSAIFDHLADSLHHFLSQKSLLNAALPLGFTFSFPMKHYGLKKGILTTWTKSFACQDGVGEDAVKMLEEAIARRGGMHVQVVAILNDTTGTLLAGSYLDHECAIGLVMGTGCNAAYVERLECVDKWTEPIGEPKQVVIDIEWGAFGDNKSLDFLKTKFDRTIDAHSNHVGSFTFEKLFSGHYIGDLVRLVLLDLYKEGLVFAEVNAGFLHKWHSITADNMSDIERDAPGASSHTRKVLRKWFSGDLDGVTDFDIDVVKYVCANLSYRVAQCVSAALSVLVSHLNRPRLTIAIDGSQYRHHPKLHDLMMTILNELCPQQQCRLILARDGSGRGGAFAAAVATRKHDSSLMDGDVIQNYIVV